MSHETSHYAPQEVIDLVEGSAPSDWRQHGNGGGWIYRTAVVSESAHVAGDARVYGDAGVYGNARVYGDAWVKSPPLYTQGS